MISILMPLALSLAPSALPVASQVQTAFDYVVRIEDPNAGLVDMELTVRHPSADSLELYLPESFSYTGLAEPQLRGEVAAPGIKRKGHFHWSVPSAGENKITINWSVPLNHRELASVPISDSYEFPYLASDHGMLVAGALFLAPNEWPGEVEPKIQVRFELPEGWTAIVPWPKVESGNYHPASLSEVHNDIIAVGKTGAWKTRVIQAGKCEVTVAIAPSYDGVLEQVGEPIDLLIRAELELFDRVPREHYLFIFGRSEQPSDPGSLFFGGSPKGSSMTLLLGGDIGTGGSIPAEIIRESVSHLIAHEFFHTWTTPDIAYPDDLRFVAEGFTDYYAFLVAARVGLSSTDSFKAALATNIENYLKAAASKQYSLITAGGPAFFEGGSAYVMSYSGGLAYAALCDRLIRQKGAGKSLDDFMRAFNNDPRFLAEPKVSPTAAEFFNLLGTFIDPETAAHLESLARAKTPMDVITEFTKAGVDIKVDMALTQPNLRANLKGTQIAGIDLSGLGGSLGLRDGDILKTINGVDCKNANDVYAAWSNPQKSRMSFTLERSGESIKVDVPLEPAPKVVIDFAPINHPARKD